MSRVTRVLTGVLSLSLLGLGLVSGPGAVAAVPSAESDFGAQFESDGSLLKSFDAEVAAKDHEAQVARVSDELDASAGPFVVVDDGEGERLTAVRSDTGDVSPLEPSAAVAPPVDLAWMGPERWGIELLPGQTYWGADWRLPDDATGAAVQVVRARDEVIVYDQYAGDARLSGLAVSNRQYDGSSVDIQVGVEYVVKVWAIVDTEWSEPAVSEPWRAVWKPGVLDEQALGSCVCDSSTSSKVVQGLNADPVNTATGNFTESVTDAQVSAPGVSFDLTRVYNSADDSVGLLGRGWSFPYGASLDVGASGQVVYRAEDGQRVRHGRAPDGSYISTAGVTSELFAEGDGYRLETRSHESLTFDADGRLIGWVDSSDQGLSFAYANGRLASITDAAGRTVSVALDVDGRITRVELADGRAVSYGYDGDLLTSVTDLREQVWSYAYDDGGRLESIVDPLDRQITLNVYDSAGRVESQTDATGGLWQFYYPVSQFGWTTVFDPRDGAHNYYYASNVLLEYVDPLGNRTEHSYDDDLNLIEVIDPRQNATQREYDARGNKISETNPAGHVQTWAWDADDNLIEHVGPTGTVSTWEYNAAHLPVLESQTSADGSATRSRTWGYNARGLPTSEVSWGGRETTFTYDAAGNWVTQTTGEGNTTSWGYDASGRMLTETDPRGDGQDGSYTTSFAYDDGDNVVTITDPRSHQTHKEYDAVGNLATELFPDGSTTTYEWDAAGRVISKQRSGWEQPETYLYYAGMDGQLGAQTDATGAVTKWGYDAANRMTSMRLPRGSLPGATPDEHTFRYTYDRAGNRTGERDPAGNWTEFGYNVLDWQTSATDPAGGVTSYTYNRAGMVRTVTDPNGSRTVTQWDGFLREDRLTDARGNTTTQAWGADDLLESVTTPLGNTTSYTYDLDSRQVSMSLPGGVSTWTYGYDAAGNQTSVTDPLEESTTSAYDEAGNLVSTTDANGNTTAWAWDAMNRLASVTAADGAETSYVYDQLGNLTSRTDPNEHVTTYGYDAVGRLLETIDPLGRKQTHLWDADGNLAESVTARGHEAADVDGDPAPWTVDYAWDGRGLLTAVDSPDPGVATEYVYDELGRKVEAIGPGLATPHNTLFYGYDPGSRLTSLRRGSAEFTYGYDADGNVTSRTYPDGTVVDATFDVDGRQTTSTRTTDDGVVGKPVRFYYHATGQIARIRYTNTGGAQRDELRVYDAAQRLSGVFNEDPDGTDRISGFALDRDGVGNPTQVEITGTRAPAGTRSYSYDDRNRLTGVCYAAGCDQATESIGYSYDQVGNRTEQTRVDVENPGATSYTYDAADQLTQTVTTPADGGDPTTTDYTWDADGNLTTAGQIGYEFDVLNREVSRTGPDGTYTTVWDPDSRRMSLREEGQATQSYFWDINYTDGLPRLAVQADSSGAGRRTWSYASQDGTSLDVTLGSIGEVPLADLLTDEGYDLHDGGGADTAAVEQANWLHHDYLQSVVNTTAHDARQVKTQHDYEPYGARDPTLLTADAFDPLLGYNSQYHDPTGNIHLRARQYNPDTGTFTATDPVAPDLADPYLTTYHYAFNNPLRYVDPGGESGLESYDGTKTKSSGAWEAVWGVRAEVERSNERRGFVAPPVVVTAPAATGSSGLATAAGVAVRFGSVLAALLMLGGDSAPGQGQGGAGRNHLALDNNVLVGCFERGAAGTSQLDAALAGRTPVIPLPALYEFLNRSPVVRSARALWVTEFLLARGGFIGPPAQQGAAARWNAVLKGAYEKGPVGKFGEKDARILDSAAQLGIPILTADDSFYRKMVRIGYPAEKPRRRRFWPVRRGLHLRRREVESGTASG